MDWVARTGERGKIISRVTELVRYPKGVDVAKHIDVLDGEYPTQALLTIDGKGEMLIYDDLESDAPRCVVPIKPGTLIFLRGNETAGLKQLPHEVRHSGQRTLLTVSSHTERSWAMDLKTRRHQLHPDSPGGIFQRMLNSANPRANS